ncbi:MAG: PolC-type DNA polymerase III [Bacilli bacterium]|nr:PolC-type DNA polymerase III [Bacilli bacterium]
MTDKMISFLNHIHIENIDAFDIDFEMVGRNRFKREQIDMVIVKQTPWKYQLLREFQDGLNTLTYPYLLRFSYVVRPIAEDVISLFDEWYQTLYRIPHNLLLEGQNESIIKVTYANEAEKEQYKSSINDFRDFLDFLNYEFSIIEEVAPQEETINVSKSEMRKIVQKATKEAVETVEEESSTRQINDRSEVEEMIAQEKAQLNEETEDQLLKLARQNAREMARDRERARLNRRGNYEPLEGIDDIVRTSDHVDFSAKTFSVEINEYGDKKKLNIGLFDDKGGAIYANMYQNASLSDETIEEIKKWGTNVRVRGAAYYDEYNKSMAVKAHYVDLLPPDEIEKEKCEGKRVELHLHSNMSTMDGISHMIDYAKYAKALGHTAMAITDHAVVQGYPDAQEAGKKTGIKMLYGVEFYMVDDELKYIKNPSPVELNKSKYVVLDLETTGLNCYYDRIIEFGAVKVEHGIVTESMDILINPERPLPKRIVEITNITDKMLEGQPKITEALPKILNFIGDAILVTHNASFDFSFLQHALMRCNMPIMNNAVIDTLPLSRYLFPESRSHTLGSLCRNMDVVYDEDSAHRADYDAKVLNDVWQPMLVLLTKKNHHLTHAELAKLETPKSLLKHIRPTHVIALAKNKEGLKSLYKLVSYSHIDYLAEVPKIPRHEIEKLRENLIIGSACFNGEVFRNAQYYGDDVLKDTIAWYDYIEIQPLENYSFLINMGDMSEEELVTHIKDIVRCADEVGKPVCATGDVHYVTKKHKVFRDVYISAKGIGGVNHPLNPYKRSRMTPFENPDQHYRSTDEMLECMKFLGEEKAYEVTVNNTNAIADMIEPIMPVPNDHLYTPTIENCEENLKNMCFNKAHELYGDPLPEYIQNRLDKELNGIISNGYSVIYYIAHLLIKKANEDGYIVGSRGSVGSSFVATMSNITEVNPLPPHYRCPKCKHLEWTKETMPQYRSGYDLPDKVCPECGTPMVHDGQDIPFETFLGFNADKTPDIDLNFPGDYQAKAHDYTKVLLGENNVFRAGTIETVADKTAFGFARGYIERKGLDLETYPKVKIAYLASGCIDVKRTTGQHPGGIVVVPTDHEVYDFTPVQYPADDIDSNWKTTHFDFHSIHDTILKLDLLGHVDPMALKMMSDLTGVKIQDIPMNDKKVLSLFSSAEALGMSHDYTNAKTGALLLPEFGTEFVRGVLEETNPKTFSDLVIISGLTHGTGVWQGNSDELVKAGTATLQEVIGCRDDIMVYLIGKGIPNNIAFAIMEDVRKGRGLKEQYEEIMKANNVPEWYIESCKKIKYMFPKGHAVAYVTMAVRVGYFKIYYPLEFYATFFSVRSKQYDIKTMIKGKDAIISKIEELRTQQRVSNVKLSPKEAEQLKTLINALEMVQRGYSFSNIDLYRSDASNFVVDYETKSLIPPFITIDGLGENNAITVVEERKKGEFFSKEDLLRRTKLTSTNVQDLADMGVLDGLNESDQLSLFDF